METYITVHLENPGKLVKITYSQGGYRFENFFLCKEEDQAIEIFKKANNIHENQSFETKMYENVSYFTLVRNEQVLINQ